MGAWNKARQNDGEEWCEGAETRQNPKVTLTKIRNENCTQWINDILNIVLVLCDTIVHIERHFHCAHTPHRADHTLHDPIGDNDYGNDYDASDNDAIR